MNNIYIQKGRMGYTVIYSEMHLPTAVPSTVVNKTEKGRSDWLEDIIMNVATEPSDTVWEDGSRRISMSGNRRDLQNKQF